MANLKDLLKYKEEVPIRDKEGKVLKTVWVRLMGDEDTTYAYKFSRVASTDKRAALRNPESVDYKDEILAIEDLNRDDHIEMIVQANQNRYVAESFVKVNREELPKIEEVAVEPDAASLEEQEKLDKKIEEQEEEYQKKLTEYVEARTSELKAVLAVKTDEELLKQAQQELVNVLPLQTFMNELSAQKLYRGTFIDEACTTREFASVQDFKDTHSFIKEQLYLAYNKLEIAPDEVKNL